MSGVFSRVLRGKQELRSPGHPQQHRCVRMPVCSQPTLLHAGATGAMPGALEGHRDRDAEPALVQCRCLFE